MKSMVRACVEEVLMLNCRRVGVMEYQTLKDLAREKLQPHINSGEVSSDHVEYSEAFDSIILEFLRSGKMQLV